MLFRPCLIIICQNISSITLSFYWLKSLALQNILVILSQMHATQCPRSIHTCLNGQSASISRSWNFMNLDGKYSTCATMLKIAKPRWSISALAVHFGTQASLQSIGSCRRAQQFQGASHMQLLWGMVKLILYWCNFYTQASAWPITGSFTFLDSFTKLILESWS